MQINITGRHFDVTPALEDYVNKRCQKLARHAEQIQTVHVIFAIEKLAQVAEATISMPGEQQLFASTSAENMYKAVDLLVDKLDRQVIKVKEKSSEHRNHLDADNSDI